ncbi:hypothetical protein LZ31DRAFT_292915 [Colletotrichum somersetense]|nr:hypothetical protein LZ31DRAFT_292915 [Colletotrichum somersetense]
MPSETRARMPPTFRKNQEILLARDAQSPCVLPWTPFGSCCTRQQSTTTTTKTTWTTTQTILACGYFVLAIPSVFSSVTERTSQLGKPPCTVGSSQRRLWSGSYPETTI